MFQDSVWNLVTFSTYFVEILLEKTLKAVALHAGYTSILEHVYDKAPEKASDAVNGGDQEMKDVSAAAGMLLNNPLIYTTHIDGRSFS